MKNKNIIIIIFITVITVITIIFFAVRKDTKKFSSDGFTIGQSPVIEIETSLSSVDEVRSALYFVRINEKGREERVSGIEFEVIEVKDGKAKVSFTPPPDLPSGRFRAVINEGFLRDIKQDFSWGVLAINTNKSMYTPDDIVKFSFAVLDEKGGMDCSAKLTLEITKPDGNTETLSLDDGTITRNSKECQTKDIVEKPDYQAQYPSNDQGLMDNEKTENLKLNTENNNQETINNEQETENESSNILHPTSNILEVGSYRLKLTAFTDRGSYTIKDSFEVKEYVPFDVERITATRIYPPKNYPVNIIITANEDFEGYIEETIPSEFKIVNDQETENEPSNILHPTSNINSALVWENINLKKGETITLSYTYDAPDFSPYFYLLGYLQLKIKDSQLTDHRTPNTVSDSEPSNIQSFGSAQDKLSTSNIHPDSEPSNIQHLTSNIHPVFSENRRWQIASDDITSLRPSSDGTVTGWTTSGGSGSNLYAEIDDDPDSPNDSDYVKGPNKTDSQMFVLLSDTPSDFTEASSVEIKGRHQENGSGDDTVRMYFQIYQSDESTAITTETNPGAVSVQGSWTTSTMAPTISGTNTKTAWDGGRLKIRQDYTKNGPTDTTSQGYVSAVEINITYYPMRINQRAYIFENDDGANVNSNTDIANANTAITGVKKGERLVARFQVDNESGTSDTKTLRLQYDKNDSNWSDVEPGSPTNNSGANLDNWNTETVDSTGNVQDTSIAIGTNGYPVISYYDQTNTDLKVVACGNASCSSGNTTTTVDSTGDVGEYTSIAIGINGYPVVSYYDYTNYDLKVVACGNATCSSGNTTTTVDSTGTVGSYTSIAIGSSGYPVISYYDQTNTDLKVVACGNASCSSGNTTTTVDSTGDVGEYTSIAIDSAGYPVVSYYDDTNDDLKVMACGNATCSSGNTTTTVDSTGSVGSYTSIAIGSSGYPVVSYLDYTNYDLKVVACGNATCSSGNTTTTVDSTGNVGLGASIAIDSAGYPVVSYYDATNLDLKVVACGNASCSSGNTTTTVDSTGSVGSHTSITIGTNGYPVVSYFDATNLDLKIASMVPVAEISSSWALSGADGDDLTAIVAGTCGTTSTQNGEFIEGKSVASELTLADDTCTELAYAIETKRAVVGKTYRLRLVSDDDSRSSLTSYSYYPTFTIVSSANNTTRYSKANIMTTDGSAIAVDSRDTGSYSSIATASSYTVISHYDATNDDLLVTYCSDKVCHPDNVTTTTVDSTGSVGQFTSIAIGSNGYPVVSYYDATNLDLKVVACGNAACSSGNTTTTVDSTGSVGGFTSIAIGTNGYPVVSYFDDTNDDLKVVACGNAACSSDNTTTTVDSTGAVGSYTSIAIGTNGYPVVSYYDVTNDDLKVVACGNAACSSGNTTTTVDSTGLVGIYTSIAIGTNGYPVVSYFDDTNDDLKVVACGNAACSSGNTTTTVDSTGGVGTYTSIAIGVDGYPVVSYYDTTNLDLKVVACGNAACSSDNTTTTVDSTGDVGQYTSIAIDSAGYPVVSYYNYTNLHLKVVACGNAACSSISSIYFPESSVLTDDYSLTTVDSTGSVGSHTSIAIGTNGYPVVSYFDDTNDDLKVVACGNAACSSGNTTTTVDSTGYVGQHTSIAIGTNGYPVVSYYDYTNADLKVLTCGNASCSSGNTTTTVDSTGTVGSYTSIAIGTNGYPVVSYFDATNYDLKIVACGNAACSSGNTTTTVDSTGDVGQYTSIAIGTNGYPVVSYFDDTNDDLKVVACGNAACSSGNTTTTVDSTGYVGQYTSIAIWTNGYPVVSYYDLANDDLKVVACGNAACSSGNTTTTVDSTGYVGQHTSIAIGTNGYPVVSYYDYTNADLKVLTCGNASCSSGNTTTTVDSARIVGYYTSIAIGLSGYPVVSYYDWTNSNLKVAVEIGLPAVPLGYFNNGIFGDRQFKFKNLDQSSDSQIAGSSALLADSLTYLLDHLGYSSSATDDSSFDFITSATTTTISPYTYQTSYTPVYYFADKYDSNTGNVEVTWKGKSTVACSTNNIKMDIFRFGSTNAWENIDSDSTCLADTSLTLTATISENLSDYYFERVNYDSQKQEKDTDSEYWTYIRVYQEEGDQTLYTGYWALEPTVEPFFNMNMLNLNNLNLDN